MGLSRLLSRSFRAWDSFDGIRVSCIVLHMYLCVYVYVCMYVFMYVCMYVYVYVYK